MELILRNIEACRDSLRYRDIEIFGNILAYIDIDIET